MIPDPTQYFSSAPQVREFFLARQPILDRNQNLLAYELLFRGVATRREAGVDDLHGAASIVAHVSELRIENVVGSARAFFNVDTSMLMGNLLNFLPYEKIVLEIPQTAKITPELVRRVAEMADAGYTFALDDVITFSEYIKPLLPLIQIVKIDTSRMTQEDLVILVRQFKQAEKMLVAEKVETVEQFRNYINLGFDYYQGYYFAKPIVLSGKKLTTSTLAILRLVALVARDADNAEIEHSIKKEASLFLSLLRLVNSPGMGVAKSIDSLNDALLVLGRRRLRQWLQIQLYVGAHASPHHASPLLLLATTRGKLLELIALKLKPAHKSIADTAFMVGMMSLLDALFGQPMKKILEQITVAKDVREALLHRVGFFGELLKVSEYVEKPGDNGRLLAPLLSALGLPAEDLYPLQLAAFEWSNSLLPLYVGGDFS